jgi:hypothetical protein
MKKTLSFTTPSFFLIFLLPTWIMALATQNTNTERRPWDVFRFARQSSKFVNLPFLPSGTSTVPQTIRPGQVLWQADSQRKNPFTMAPLDDVVMGGASESTFDANTGIWSGVVTDANNGGFIGIRSTPGFVWDMSDCQGLEWKVKLLSDKSSSSSSSLQNNRRRRRFKFVLRDSRDFNGITWSTSVDLQPGGSIQTVRIRLDRQIPALFARTVPDQTFRKDNVVSVQIAYSKFEYDGKLNPNFELGNVQMQLLELRAF